MSQEQATNPDQSRKWNLLFESGTPPRGRIRKESSFTFNLLIAFYSIEISLILTLVLFTITHLLYGWKFLVATWFVLIVILVIFYYFIVLRRTKNFSIAIDLTMGLSNEAEELRDHRNPVYVGQMITEIFVPQTLTSILGTNEEAPSNSDNVTSTIRAT
jgi:NADH:ubiquinone oxidoreductase subunit 3 (subunit A)